jgi:hypothetical protein
MFIEQLQILQLVKVVYLFYSEKIMLFFYMIRHVWLQFGFVNLETEFHGNYVYDRYDLVMRILGFRSQSAIVNLTNWVFIWPLMTIVYIIIHFSLGYLMLHKIKGVLLSPMRKLVNWMFPGMFIRIFNLSFILLFFVSYHEVHRDEYTSNSRWSWWVALAIILVCALYVVFVLMATVLGVIKPQFKTHAYLSEFFSGLRSNNYS